jgi:hypothetical protein
MVSKDDGESFEKVLGYTNQGITDEVADIEVGADGSIYAALGITKSEGIYRSADGSAGSWERLFKFDWTSRIELATAPSDSSVLYAATAYGSSLNGLFRSNDKGSTWEELSVDFMDNNYAAFYAMALAVNPKNHEHVLFGTVDLFQSMRHRSWRITGQH